MDNFVLPVQEQGHLIVYFSKLKNILYKVLITTNATQVMVFFQIYFNLK